MNKNIFLYTILILLALTSCQKEATIHPDKLKLFGKNGSWGLQNEKGELVLDTTFLFLKIRSDIKPGEYYIKYTRKDGRKGIYYKTLDEPYFEVGKEVAYFEMINSMDFFSFAGPKTDGKGNKLEGVIDANQNIILVPEYRNILYYGGKYFYASDPGDRKYAQFGMDGKYVENRGRYGWVYSKHGVTFASKNADGGGDIWGAKGCLLDEEGKEITEHEYQSIGIFQSLFDKSKIFVSMRKDGISSLYYPNGEQIYKEEYRAIAPVSDRSSPTERYKKELREKYGNVVGIFTKDKTKYYLTYEGKAIKEKS